MMRSGMLRALSVAAAVTISAALLQTTARAETDEVQPSISATQQAATSPTTSSPTPPPGDGKLPQTGTDANPLGVGVGVVLLVAGGGTLLAARRRRR